VHLGFLKPWRRIKIGILAQAGVKDSYRPKSGYFTAIILCSVKMVAYRHRHALIIASTGDRLLKFINIDDLE